MPYKPNPEARGVSRKADREGGAGRKVGGSDFTYEEVVKALDLRQASPRLNEQLVPLTDFYRVKRLGNSRELNMHYATTADGIDWRGSATHPSTAKWKVVGVSHTGAHHETLKHEYTVDLTLADLAKGETTPVIEVVPGLVEL